MALLSSSSYSAVVIRSELPVKQAVCGRKVLRTGCTGEQNLAAWCFPRNRLAVDERQDRLYCLKVNEAAQGMKPDQSGQQDMRPKTTMVLDLMY